MVRGKLERGQRRGAADGLGGGLIDADAVSNVGAVGLVGMSTGQKRCRGPCVVAGAVAVRAPETLRKTFALDTRNWRTPQEFE